jgi:hypothetical protein
MGGLHKRCGGNRPLLKAGQNRRVDSGVKYGGPCRIGMCCDFFDVLIPKEIGWFDALIPTPNRHR